MNNKTFYSILLIIIYILYIKYSNIVKINIETFLPSKKIYEKIIKKEINKLNKSVKNLRSNIIDLASVAEHNTLNICRIEKSIEEASFHADNINN